MNIIVPRHYTKEVEANFTAGLKGEYQVQVIDKEGNIRYPLGEQFHPNVITNIGLARLLTNANFIGNPAFDCTFRTIPGAAGAIQFCRVGSSTTAAAATDTQLLSQLADPAPTSTMYIGTGANMTDNSTVTSTGEVTHKWTYQFAAVGAGGASINEIGLGWDGTTPQVNNTLFSRFKTPSTISITDGQILRVVYQLTISCPQYITSTPVTSLESNGFNMEGDMKVIGGPGALFGELSSQGLFPPAITGRGELYGLVAGGYLAGGTAAGGRSLGLLLAESNAFPAVGSGLTTPSSLASTITRVSRTLTTGSAPYVDTVAEFSVSQPANTVSTVRSILLAQGINEYVYTPASARVQILLDSAQEKADTHKLQIGIRSGWTRL